MSHQRRSMIAMLVALLLIALSFVLSLGATSEASTAPPASPAKLIFIHHSCGENWLRDDDGGLAIALRDNGYFVSDTNYGWGPECSDCEDCWGAIGDCTDILLGDNGFTGRRTTPNWEGLL